MAVLTKEGSKQAEAIAQKLSHFNVDVIYCSKLKRAIQTAQIIAKKLGKKVIFNSAFNERSWGIFEGKSWDRNKTKLMRKYESEKSKTKPDGGESYRQFKKRILGGVESLIEKHEGQVVLLVSHGGVIRALIPALKGVPRQQLQDLHVYNTSVTIFKMAEGEVVEELLADVSHLEN